jgi:hypothetical protein
MTVLLAGNFASLLGVDAYHSTASTGRDPDYTDAQIAFPQAGEHAIGFPLNLLQADFPDIWLHCRMHATQSADFGFTARIFYINDNAQALNEWYVEKNNLPSSYQYRAVADGTGTSYGSYWAATSATTYTFDFHANRSGSEMTVEFYVNGALVSAVSRAANSSSRWVSAGIRNGLGRRASGSNPIYVSEVILATSSTIGMRVASLRPSGAGHFNEWIGTPADLDDFDETTGVVSNEVNQRQTRVHAAAPEGPINRVFVQGRYIPNDVIPRLTPMMRIGGTNYFGPSPLRPGEGTTHPSIVNGVFPLNPATGLPWIYSDLDALDAGFRSAGP